MKNMRSWIGISALIVSLAGAGCAGCDDDNNTNNANANNTNNDTNNGDTNNANNTNNGDTNNGTTGPTGPTGAGDELVAACEQGGPAEALTQEGVQCAAPQSPTYDDCGARTPYNDDVTADLTLSGCLESDGFTVDAGATLTLEPGTSIQFTSSSSAVLVDGTIIAEGTAAQPITFIGGPTAGSWGGIRLRDVSAANSFQNVIFENGGGFDFNTGAAREAMLVVQDAPTQVAIADTAFRGSLHHAIHIADPGADVTLSNVEFEGNADAAIVLPPNQLGALSDDLAFGDDQWVDVLLGDVTTSQTAPACVPWRFTDGVTVTNDALLTIQQGATLSFRSDAYITVNQGFLNAVGTPDEAILFTGFQKQPGSWGGINFNDESVSEDNLLENVIIEYAGGFDWNTGAIKNTSIALRNQAVRLAVRNSIIRESSALGFYANNEEAQVDFQNVAFENNAEGAAEVPPNYAGAFDETSAYGDGQHVLIRAGEFTTANALTACVPYRVLDTPTVGAGTEVTIAPGARIEFAQNAGFQVNGTLDASGSEDNIITFTGVDDEPGAWGGMRFSDDSDGIIDWSVIEYGGGIDWNTGASQEANLNVRHEGVNLSLSNLTLRESAGAGIHFSVAPTLSCDNILIEDDPAVSGEFESLDEACN